MELLKSNLKGVIGSSKNGILLCNLENEYKRITNSSLNYQSFDYPDLISFLKSLNDIIKLSYYGNTCYVHLITTVDDPQCLKKLCNLIQTTKPSKKSYKKNQNIPSNIILKANEFDNLKISVPNDWCQSDKEFNGNTALIRSNSFVNQNYNQRNNAPVFNGNAAQTRNNYSFNQNDYRNKNNGVPPYLLPKKSYSQQINNNNSVPQSLSSNLAQAAIGNSCINTSEPRENSETKKSFTNGYQHLENADRITLNESTIKINSKPSTINIVDKLPSKPDFNTSDKWQNGNASIIQPPVLDWLVNYPDISIDILHKPVKIFGIQSGYAFVVISESIRDSIYLQTNSFNCAFPGDVFLWQPPITDPNRPKSSIDITNAVPVISLERISSDAMKVRVIGPKILLEVQVTDLYEMPKNISDLNTLRREINIRQTTFVRLAIIPKFVNIWNINILSGLYFSPDCLDNDAYIFERCEKRGDFLNVMILIYYFNNMVPKDSRSEQKIFVEQLLCEINKSLRSLVPEFKNMTEKSINKSPDTSLLLNIDIHRTSMENKMMIGCTRFFSCRDPSMTNNRFRIGSDEIVLERIVYNQINKSFHYFDNEYMMANVAFNNPFWGLYMINEDFIVSRLSYVTKLRFQAAILLHILSCTKLKNAIQNYR